MVALPSSERGGRQTALPFSSCPLVYFCTSICTFLPASCLGAGTVISNTPLPQVDELFEFLMCAVGLARTTHCAAYALPMHLLVCLLAYSLYKPLIT
jgi:hypothetical protein